ncbi:putative signal transduction histidine kinase [Candidatus Terasakiella magnetica]|nr:putative signal transduction histidine kinase [Candidatus Terasakiella magnetica]
MTAALVVCLLALLAVIRFDKLERDRLHDIERAQIRLELDGIRERLTTALTGPLLRTHGIVAQIVAHGDVTTEQFQKISEVLLRGHRNVRNFALSRGTVIAMVYPQLGNESAIGVNLRNIPEQWPTIERTISARRPVLQGPVPLVQGGEGLILRHPILLSSKDGTEPRYYGIASIVLNVPGVLDDSGIHIDDPHIRIAVRDRGDGGGKIFFGSHDIFGTDPVEMDVPFPYGSWQLAAIPRNGWGQNSIELQRLRALELSLLLIVGLMAFGTATLVVNRVRRAEQLKRLVAELTAANTELERFAHLASHDLREPLRTIVGFSQLLQKRYHGQIDAEANEFMGLIIHAARRMNDLIGDLVTYSQVTGKQAGFKPVDLGATCASVMDLLRESLSETDGKVTLGELPTITGDPVQLIRLFQNLIGNAIKFHHPTTPPEIEVTARPTAENWIISVADNGIGIEDSGADIFEVFRRLHRQDEYPGTGVGLAICKRIVERHGGTIWYEPNPSGGTIFRFTLPRDL